MSAITWKSPSISLPWRVPGAVAIALVLLLLLTFRETAEAMVGIWSRSETFAHAFVVPPIVAWLIWRQRELLRGLRPKPVPWMALPMAVLAALTSGRGALPRPWVVGGRSSGARVACRTAAAVSADAVLALSFPLHPPGRPEKSRAAEAHLVTDAGTRLVVIQGESDPFGSPDEVRAALGTGVEVVQVRGTHSFTKIPTDVTAAATAFLANLGMVRHVTPQT